ncbi:protoporphyrinogen oxidase [Pueribacillus theae]|uniref:Coproporphyrinogen III oxidase n=1 Tax=Pueribacillus theae TaxID=2171751 RepID=A0A2U1K2N4_9BACI|nr:protoporphyrinogen oxidase [Pueribacillus theae]PWA11777.1 protoporphyrinogen oxidase [Pueribacillus theae]
MTAERKKVAIIGGGITGLSAAFYLYKEGNMDFTLFEATDHLGGKIQTVKHEGFTIERGPDSFVARKKSASKLAADVGLESELVGNYKGQAFVLNNDTLYPIPGGAIMGIPTELGPFIETELFSASGKARAALDFILPRTGRENEDQSLGGFFRKRLGDEIVENLIEPLLSGIYAGDIDRLSLMSTFPQFYEVERKYRSLILGMKKTTPAPKKQEEGAKKPSNFLTLKNGLESLVKAIENALPPESIRKKTAAESLRKYDKKYELRLSSGEKERFDAVLITTPHMTARKLLEDYSFMGILRDIPTTTVANVAMAFDEEKVNLTKDGTGFVVSRNANYTITACTFTHRKWLHTTPNGKVLLRTYVGRPGNSEIVEATDEEIIDVSLHDLNRLIDIKGRPDFYFVTRWREAMPQYTVGHQFRIQAVKENLAKQLPGVFLAGSSYEGVGIPDCIDQGIDAVKKITEYMKG